MPTLSICIATLNRANVIAATLDSIFAQLCPTVEVIVVDGASTDSTPDILEHYCRHQHALKYYRETQNSGVDADFDRAVHYAKGKYCWLMTDDDLLRPGAVQRVLLELTRSPDLVVVDAEVRTADLRTTLQKSRMHLTTDRHFEMADDHFLETAGDALSFIASVVIRRDRWLQRSRERYYGSLFIHAGVILQAPPLENIVVLAEPLITIRYGVAMWTSKTFEIWMFKWPELIWSSHPYSDQAKRAVCARQPWRSPIQLLKHRARGSYSKVEYRKHLRSRIPLLHRYIALAVASMPAGLANFFAVTYVITFKREARLGLNDLLNSPHSSWASHFLSELFPLKELRP